MTKASPKRNHLYTPEGASKLAMVAIVLMIAMKVVGSIITSSIGIRADAIHSSIDLIGVLIGFIALRIAGKPKDRDHLYGHGKAENLAGFIIAGLIFFAAGSIIYEAFRRLIGGGAIEMVGIGIWITAVAVVINVVVSWWMLRVARKTDSAALEATGRDLYADVLSSVAVLFGLVLVKVTAIVILDPIVAILVGLLIGRTAYLTLKKSFSELMDKRLPAEEEEIIKSCIIEHKEKVVGLHELRTRKAGNKRFVDLHLVMPLNTNLENVHRVCDHLERHIRQRLLRTNITIHVEPCTIECDDCIVECDIRSLK
ncbi:cation diffusion facilitator family transporter [Chloroflexota bacterium]